MSLTLAGTDRRRHARVETPPMYHAVAVRRPGTTRFSLCGHVYNLSVGGVQFDLDEPIAPGTEIEMRLRLPASASTGPARDLRVRGRVVWLDDSDSPGPVRLATAFTGFARSVDEARLTRYLNRPTLRLAA